MEDVHATKGAGGAIRAPYDRFGECMGLGEEDPAVADAVAMSYPVVETSGCFVPAHHYTFEGAFLASDWRVSSAYGKELFLNAYRQNGICP